MPISDVVYCFVMGSFMQYEFISYIINAGAEQVRRPGRIEGATPGVAKTHAQGLMLLHGRRCGGGVVAGC